MKDISGIEWEYSSGERYAVKWLEEHGFEVVIQKRYISKDIILVSKDGVSDTFPLPLGNSKYDHRGIMRLFERNWNLLCALKEKEAANK